MSSQVAEYQFRTKPFRHQLEEFLAHRDDESRAIFWEQGTGKTKLIIDTAAWLLQTGKIDGMLVIAPNGVHQNWVLRELVQHMPEGVLERTYTFVFSSQRRNAKYLEQMEKVHARPEFVVVAMGYDGFMTKRGRLLARKFLQSRRVLFVLDESRRIKSPAAKRTRAIVAEGCHASYRRILTGTPVANGPFDVYAPIKFLDETFWSRHGLGSYLAFKTTFGVWEQLRLGHRQFQKLLAFRSLESLNKLLSTISNRVVKSEVLDLPPKLYSTRTFEMSPEQARHYREIRDDFVTFLATGEPLTAPLAITRELRLRQILSGYLPSDLNSACLDFPELNARLYALEDLLDEVPHQAIIWANFTRDIDLICGLLGDQVVRYDGKVGEDDRTAAINRFQAGEVKYFVGNPAAGGTGLTLHAARTVIYYNNDFDLEKRLQSEDRAHRIGQAHPVNYIDLVCEGTVDERIADALQRKELISARILHDHLRQETLIRPLALPSNLGND
jgi:SNF2 family DNA or RNA helicase